MARPVSRSVCAECNCNPARNGVLKQGYLVKKGHIRHSWRTRWFILKKNSLEYFKSREDIRPKGKVTLVGASLNCPPPDPDYKRKWLLILTTVEGKEYLIEAPDQTTRDEWQLAIEDIIRKLDPSKRGHNHTAVTLSRSLLTSSYIETSDDDLRKQREIVQAMQDMFAGVKLEELKRGKIGKHVDKYFTGKDAVDWLIEWFFVSDRKDGVTLANSMLRNGFFHAIEGEEGKNGLTKSTITVDKLKCYQFQDSEMARYIFVSFATVQTVEKLLFSESEEDTFSPSGSSSPELGDITHPNRSPSIESLDSSSDNNKAPLEDRIIRQGFLLKKGHFRRNWKIRRFVLKEKATHLVYYKVAKIKTKPQGLIPLKGSTLSTIDGDQQEIQPIPNVHKKRYSLPPRLVAQTIVNKPNMFCIETVDQVRYIIQTESDTERMGWISDIATQIEWLAQRETRSESVLS